MRIVLIGIALFLISCGADIHHQTIDEMARTNKRCLDAGLKSITIIDTMSEIPIAITCAASDYK